jgi:hypothetical protein
VPVEITGPMEITGPVEITGAVERGAGWLVRAQLADGGWSNGAGSGGNRRELGPAPASRYAQRRRGSLMPGLLLPLGALGQFIAAGGGAPDERAGREQRPRLLTETGLSGAIGISQ